MVLQVVSNSTCHRYILQTAEWLRSPVASKQTSINLTCVLALSA